MFKKRSMNQSDLLRSTSISFASPSIWNSLPQHIRSSDSLSAFRGLLKTFLYQKSLPP